jgi:hypothetical protein
MNAQAVAFTGSILFENMVVGQGRDQVMESTRIEFKLLAQLCKRYTIFTATGNDIQEVDGSVDGLNEGRGFGHRGWMN